MNKEKQEKIQELISSPEVQEKMKALNNDGEVTSAKIIDFWKAQGVELTEEDLKVPSHEMSEDELEAVSGGGGCGCFAGGGGTGDYLECICYGAGSGGLITIGRHSGKLLTGGEAMWSARGGCWCIVTGAGATNWGKEIPHIMYDDQL